MRFVAAASTALLLAAGVLLAGCTQNSPGNGDDGGVFGSCPSWVKGLSGFRVRDDGAMTFTAQNAATYYAPGGNFERWDLKAFNSTHPGAGLASGVLEFNGAPLDQLVFDFRPNHADLSQSTQLLYIQDGTMLLEFFADEGGYPGERLRAYDQARGPSSAQEEWVFTADPAKHYAFYNITLRVDLTQPSEDPHPRGVFLHWQMIEVDLDGNPDTTTMELIRYSPELWYRTCSSDGTRYGNR